MDQNFSFNFLMFTSRCIKHLKMWPLGDQNTYLFSYLKTLREFNYKVVYGRMTMINFMQTVNILIFRNSTFSNASGIVLAPACSRINCSCENNGEQNGIILLQQKRIHFQPRTDSLVYCKKIDISAKHA